MYYAVAVPQGYEPDEGEVLDREGLIFNDINEARAALKKYHNSRMKNFEDRDRAVQYLLDPDGDESFFDASCADLSASLERLTLKPAPSSPVTTKKTSIPDETLPYPSVKPGELNGLRRKIESGDYQEVYEIITSNPRYLINVSDSAVCLMAGPKYNACHIAARANKPDIMALILFTVSNISYMSKLYPDESSESIQDRTNHLLDAYLNTPDPRQGNTPLHFACKLGHYRVVRVLLTFEGCDLNLKDSSGLTAEEIGAQDSKIKDLFKSNLHLPSYKDRLKKRLLMWKRSKQNNGNESGSDLDVSFSDDSFISSV